MRFLSENKDVAVASCLGYYINESGNEIGEIYDDLTTREAFRDYIGQNRLIAINSP